MSTKIQGKIKKKIITLNRMFIFKFNKRIILPIYSFITNTYILRKNNNLTFLY